MVSGCCRVPLCQRIAAASDAELIELAETLNLSLDRCYVVRERARARVVSNSRRAPVQRLKPRGDVMPE